MRSILLTLLVLVVVPAFGRNVIVTENAVRLDNIVWCEEEETVEVSSLPVTRGLIARWTFDASNALDTVGDYHATNYVYGAGINFPLGGIDGERCMRPGGLSKIVGWTSYQAAGQNTIEMHSNGWSVTWWGRALTGGSFEQPDGIVIGGYRTQSGTSETLDGDFQLYLGMVYTNSWRYDGRIYRGGASEDFVDWRAPIPYQTPVAADWWHHYAACYDGITLSTHINGKSNGVARVVPTFYLNHLGGGNDAEWFGWDNINVHNVCLSSNEVMLCQEGFQ